MLDRCELAKDQGGCTLPDAPSGGPVEVVEAIGGWVEEPDVEELDTGPLAKTAAGHEAVNVSVQVVAPALAGPMPGQDLLSKATTSVASGAAPSNALTGTQYGLTFPESVQVTIGAKKVGTKWQPVVKDLVDADDTERSRILRSDPLPVRFDRA